MLNLIFCRKWIEKWGLFWEVGTIASNFFESTLFAIAINCQLLSLYRKLLSVIKILFQFRSRAWFWFVVRIQWNVLLNFSINRHNSHANIQKTCWCLEELTCSGLNDYVQDIALQWIVVLLYSVYKFW